MEPQQPLRWIILGVILLLFVGCCTTQDMESQESLQVLFIGNSSTYCNDLPKMFAELAQSGGHKVEVEMSAIGGWTLSDHTTTKWTLDKINQQSWDFVVLQEHDLIASIPSECAKQTHPAARSLDEIIRAQGASTILFMTWGCRDADECDNVDFDEYQARLYTCHMDVANELRITVAPVGIAWQNALAQAPHLDLWYQDGIHASRTGSYLVACVFYSVIYQQSPEGLDYTDGLALPLNAL